MYDLNGAVMKSSPEICTPANCIARKRLIYLVMPETSLANFDAEVYVEDNRYEARFLDISQSGCAVLIKNESVDLEQGAEIFIEPGIKNIPKPYPQCKVVNVRHQADGTVVGVELVPELDLTDELKLEVFSHIILEN